MSTGKSTVRETTTVLRLLCGIAVLASIIPASEDDDVLALMQRERSRTHLLHQPHPEKKLSWWKGKSSRYLYLLFVSVHLLFFSSPKATIG
jgi:hypothetical protein